MNGGLVTIRDERPHKKLEVSQKAMALVARIYNLTKEFPKSETYGLSSQMRTSAIPIPGNIAEEHQIARDRFNWANIVGRMDRIWARI
jgi:hypothetical protein